MIGPDPIIMIFDMSVLLGILVLFQLSENAQLTVVSNQVSYQVPGDTSTWVLVMPAR
jgi:hypothetical protein